MIEEKSRLTACREALQRGYILLKRRFTPSPEGELYDSCITLKNLALVRRETPLSADYIYELLMQNAIRLRPAYAGMLTLYRSGRDEEAFAFFAEAVGSKTGRSFASILAKMDAVNPAELTAQMEVFQNLMAEKRVTQAMKRAQRNSLLMTLWASAAIFALLINFTVVVVFLNTLDMLRSVF